MQRSLTAYTGELGSVIFQVGLELSVLDFPDIGEGRIESSWWQMTSVVLVVREATFSIHIWLAADLLCLSPAAFASFL